MFSLQNPQYIGRNYLQDDYWNRANNIMTIEDGVITSICSYLYPRVANHIGGYLDIKKGEQWTLSFDVLIPDEEDNGLSVVISNPQSNREDGYGYLTGSSAKGYVKGEWSHVIFSFIAKDNILDTTYIYFWYHSSFASTGVPEDVEKYWMKLKNVKLERGISETGQVPPLESGEMDFIEPNLANDTSGGWSNWIYPKNTINVLNHISSKIMLAPGTYSFSVELEFRDVQVEEGHEHYQPQVQSAYHNIEVDKTSWLYKSLGNDFSNGVKAYKWTQQIVGYLQNPIDVRTDYWSSGGFRYRKLYIKRTEHYNPIWCKSKMDIANPNLCRNSFVKSNQEGEEITKTEVLDCPNAYITEGKFIIRKEPLLITTGVWNYTLFENEDEILEKTFTASVYARSQTGTTLRLGCDNVYYSGHFGFKEFEIPGDNIWRRYRTTYAINQFLPAVYPNENSPNYKISNVFYITKDNTSVEICGWKLERGDELTEWVPYAATAATLETEQEIYE